MELSLPKCGSALLVLIVISARAQEQYRAPESGKHDGVRVSTLQFSRTLQTFLWNGRIILEPAIANGSMNLEQYLKSRAVRTGQVLIQDEWMTRMSFASTLGSSFDVVSRVHTMGVSDNRELDLGNLSQHQLLAGPRFHLPSDVAVTLLGGYELASQEGIRDKGFAYLAEARGRSIRVEDFSVSFASRSGQSFLRPRTVKAESITVSILRNFEGLASNNLTIQFSNHGREFYTAADPGVRGDFQVTKNIFRRDAREVGILDTLLYQASPGSFLAMHAGFINRTIDRGYRYKSFSNPSSISLDARIQELRFYGGMSVRSGLTAWLRSEVVLTYEEREERHSVRDETIVPLEVYQRQDQAARRLGNVSRHTGVTTLLNIIPTEKDSLNLIGSASILRYDTPDSLNTDDRDELLLVFGVEESHRFGPHLSLSVLADATLSHLVYLHRRQSANNNWNRTLRFRSRVDYTPNQWLVTVNSAEVLANYTVYDFEEQVQSVRSYSFRQASWSDSTSARIGPAIRMTFLGSVRVYERGVLRWKEFKERPENYFVEQSYWPRVVVVVTEGLVVGAGYRFFSQTRYRYAGRSRLFEGRISSLGPTAMLVWNGHNGRHVSIEGWREKQSNPGGGSRSFSNLSLTVGMVL